MHIHECLSKSEYIPTTQNEGANTQAVVYVSRNIHTMGPCIVAVSISTFLRSNSSCEINQVPLKTSQKTRVSTACQSMPVVYMNVEMTKRRGDECIKRRASFPNGQRCGSNSICVRGVVVSVLARGCGYSCSERTTQIQTDVGFQCMVALSTEADICTTHRRCA